MREHSCGTDLDRHLLDHSKVCGHETEINFPILINLARCTVRIPWESSYIEVRYKECRIAQMTLVFSVSNKSPVPDYEPSLVSLFDIYPPI